MAGKIYTVSDLCERLQLHPDTVREWIASGRLEAFKVGRRWRIPEDALLTSDVFDPGAADALA